MSYAIGTIAALFVVYLSHNALNFTRNLRNSRKCQVPVVIVPVNTTQIFWILFAPIYRRFMSRVLPQPLWRRLSIAMHGWEFHEKLRPIKEFAARDGNEQNKTYLLVGFGELEFWTADPLAVEDIALRVRDFQVPDQLDLVIGRYGPNVLTANGDDWARHRRIASSVMDERVMRTVFEASMELTYGFLGELDMLGQNKKRDSAETRKLFDALKRVTMGVLLSAGMGEEAAWTRASDPKKEDGYEMTHMESLNVVVANLVGFGLLPDLLITAWPRWLPGYTTIARIGRARNEVLKRSKIMLAQERALRAEGKSSTSTGNIMTKLLDASAEEGVDNSRALSEAEIISNLFVFTVAGFETSATLLAYAMVLLARHRDWQDWVLEEVDELNPAEEDPEPLNYASVFSRATRITAFMYETLRLYSPAPHVHRATSAPQMVQTATGSVYVPANTRVYLNAIAVHLLPSWRDVNRGSDPAFYKSDADVLGDEYSFRPSRWINPPDSPQTIHQPPKGTWIPWSMGPRVCPGQKMARVEFVAAMLALLRDNRVDASPLDGESRPQVEERLDARLRDSRWVAVLQMNDVFDPSPDKGLAMVLRRRK